MTASNKLFLVFLVLATASACAYAAYSPGARFSSRARVVLANFTCQREGFMCADCTGIVYCEPKAGGGFDAVVSENCTDIGMYCDDTTISCHPDYTPKCDPSVGTYAFKCQQVGFFPHPFNCKQYYFCVDTKSPVTATDCPGGYGYDPRTMACTVKFVNGTTCTNAVQPCTAAQAKGLHPVARSSRLYYTCTPPQPPSTDTKLYPNLFYCARNYIFISGRCVDPTTYYEGLVNGKCSERGNFYVPNCKQYNECTSINGTAYLRTCSMGMKFSMDKRTCIYQDCDLC